jgi:uncharacterized protein (UPF0548 family)
MAEWRFGRGWSEEELEQRLEYARLERLNFPMTEMADPRAWRRYYSEAMIGLEPPGPPVPGGPFERAWEAIQRYAFSDPGIVTGHFDKEDGLEGRTMLLEIKVLGLHYLCPVRVGAVRQVGLDAGLGETVRGYRYDTLHGHLESGSEWFLLTKKEKSGEVWFRIQASWRPGQASDFPNFWSRIGFSLLAQRYQLAWHRLAYLRLREWVGCRGGDSVANLKPLPQGRHLLHAGAEIIHSDLWVLNEPKPSLRVKVMGKKSMGGKIDEVEHKQLV